MADSIIQGLFGLSPYEVEQQQNASMFKAADQYAAQAPFERAAGQMYRAGGMLGGAAAESMGMVNPRVQEAQQAQAIMSQIDPSTAEGLTKGALLANQMRNPKLAYLLAQAAQKRRIEESEMKLRDARVKAYEQGGAKGRAKDGDPVQLAKDINRARLVAEINAIKLNKTPQEIEDAKDVAGAQAREAWEASGAVAKTGLLQSSPDGTVRLSENADMNIVGGITPEMKRSMIADAAASGDMEAVRALSAIKPNRSDAVGGTRAEAEGAVERAKQAEKIVESTSQGKAVFAPAGESLGSIPAQYSSEVKYATSAADASGKEVGGASGKARASIAGLDVTRRLVESQVQELLSHPGFKSTVGVTLLPGARFVHGSKESGFMRRLEQIKGGAFLKAYETLKGGGQITEVEGKKATDAIARMDISTSEEEFRAAAKDFLDAIDVGFKKLQAQAVMTGESTSPNNSPSEADINYTAMKHKITPAEVRRRLGL